MDGRAGRGGRRGSRGAAERYRESFADAPPGSWGRPIGAIKALLLAGDWDGARTRRALGARRGRRRGRSRRSAATPPRSRCSCSATTTQARVARRRDPHPRRLPARRRRRARLPRGARRASATREAVEAVLESFETRGRVPRGRPGRRHRARPAGARRRDAASRSSSARRCCPAELVRVRPSSAGGERVVITIGASDGSSASRACSTSSWISSTACSGVTRRRHLRERNVPLAPCSAQPRWTSSSIAARRSLVALRLKQRRRDAHGARDRAVRLLAALAALGQLDQAGAQQHPHVEVQVPGVDAEPLRQLPVRQVLGVARAEHLEHAQAQRMAERLELLRLVERETSKSGLGSAAAMPLDITPGFRALSSGAIGGGSGIRDHSRARPGPSGSGWPGVSRSGGRRTRARRPRPSPRR